MKIVKQQYKRYIGCNPYKGFVPFMKNSNVLCSMEFFYIPLSEILLEENYYDWRGLEYRLNKIYKRGHHAIFRIYLDYPGLESGVPLFLQNNIEMIKYSEFGGGIAPDYHSKILLDVLLKFIKELGLKYDGDKRIAFIEVGLIGHWGEWHTFPENSLMPKDNEQILIIKSYHKYFRKTKILCRYPNNCKYKRYNIGFHDDSFCFSTLATKKHHFMALMRKYELDKKWIISPIGGEVRPEEQESLINGGIVTEDYFSCVKDTHASWLINDKAFDNSVDKKIISNLSSVLGYDFCIKDIEINHDNLSFRLYNVGVAPVYYKFNCYLIIRKNKILLDYDIRNLLPNKYFTFNYELKSNDLNNKIYFMITNGVNYINLSNKYVEKELVIIYN